jgi:hypothetical protein
MYDNLPDVLDITLQRADRNVIVLHRNGDLRDKLIKHVVKSVKGIAGTRVLQKSWTPGDPPVENGIEVAYDKGQTKFTITYNRADFFNLDKKAYYHSITAVDPADAENFDTLWQGDFILNPNVEDEGDGTAAADPNEYVNQAYDKMLLLKINSDGTGEKTKDFGFNTTITFARVSLSLYKVTSSVDIFDEGVIPEFSAINPATYERIYLHGWRYVNTKEMLIQVIDFGLGPVDAGFYLMLNSIRG